MKIIKFLQNPKFIIPFVAILVILSGVLIYFKTPVLGTDFKAGYKATFYASEKFSERKVKSSLKSDFSNIDKVKENNGNYEIYFLENVDVEKLNDKLKKTFSDPGELKIYEFNPAKTTFLSTRIINTAFFSMLLWIIYMVTVFKNIGLKYGDVVVLILGDVLLTVFEVTVLIAGLSVLGFFNIYLSSMLINLMLLLFIMQIIFKIFASFRFVDYFNTHKIINTADAWKAYTLADWPTTTYIIAFVLVLIIIPISVLGYPFLEFIPLMIFGMLMAYISEISLKMHLLRGLDFVLQKLPFISLLKTKVW